VLALQHNTATIILLVLARLIGLSAVALAPGGDPQTLFTDNLQATDTTLDVTDNDASNLCGTAG
jgi:hypothetical protein